MIKDINTVKNEVIDGDICIVGTGAAGITLGLELAKARHKVIMLEGGSMEKTQSSQSFYDLENAGLSVDTNSRIRTFGGTTTVWGGGWKPLDKIDFEKRDWVPFSGWPIKYEDLVDYYDRGADLFGGPKLDEFKINKARGYLKGKKYLLEDKDIKTTLLRVLPRQKWDFAKNYRNFFESASNLEVLFNAPVTKIHLDNTKKKVAELSVGTLLGKKFKIKARHFIVACGGIENARLLLFSNVGNENDQVGRYYMDHPKFVSGHIVPNRKDIDLSLYWRPQDIGGFAIAGLQLSENIQRESKVLNSYAHFLPWYVSDQYTYTALKIFTSNSIFSKIFRMVMHRYNKISEIRVRNFMEQIPSPSNRVLLSERKDPVGNPLAKVEWSISPPDKKSLFVLHSVLKKELAESNIGNLISPILTQTENFASVKDASHHMGTTRMGMDPRSSVVDRNCKVHDTSNLFIAGSSVFPTSGHANPTATIIALAIRLADHLKSL